MSYTCTRQLVFRGGLTSNGFRFENWALHSRNFPSWGLLQISAAYKFIKSFTPDGHIVDVRRIDSFDFKKSGPKCVHRFLEFCHFIRLKRCFIDNPWRLRDVHVKVWSNRTFKILTELDIGLPILSKDYWGSTPVSPVRKVLSDIIATKFPKM